jgi:hypothetical protein
VPLEEEEEEISKQIRHSTEEQFFQFQGDVAAWMGATAGTATSGNLGSN